MRILFIAPRLPYPPIEGWRIKLFFLLKELYELGHEISLIAFAVDPSDKNQKNIKRIKQYVHKIEIYTFSQSTALSKFFSKIPLSDLTLFIKLSSVADQVSHAILEYKPDIVHFDTPHMCALVQFIKNNESSLVASVNDSYSLVLREHIFSYNTLSVLSLLRTLYDTVALAPTIRYETSIYERFDIVHTVSKVDADYLLKLNPRLNVKVIPNGVDIDYFKPIKSIQNDEKSLVIIGNFAVSDHVQNAIWFIHNIYRKLKMNEENIKLYLVGKDPPRILWREARKNQVIVTGYVKDIRPYIARATIVVDARRQRYGILNHVLQAMSMGKCIVGTPYTFFAIDDAKSWENAVISKDKKEFASNILYLLENDSVRKNIEKNARHLIEAKYSWRKIAHQYENAYNLILYNRTNRKKVYLDKKISRE